jgi:hypothetical protein
MKHVLVIAGPLLILVGLVYGFTGLLVPSIQERGASIARWEREIVKDKAEMTTALAEADRLGKQPAQAGDAPSPFESKLAEIDRREKSLRGWVESIDYERGRRKEMSMITAGFAAAGVIALLIGLRLRRARTS